MNTRKTKSKSKFECARKNLTKRFEKALKTLQNINSKKTKSKRSKRSKKNKKSKRNKRGGGFFDLFTSSAPITVNNDRVPLLGRLDGNTYIPAQTGYRSR